ncbi:hypothetical protein Tco_1152194, partial [Tanacetum coccineum]
TTKPVPVSQASARYTDLAMCVHQFHPEVVDLCGVEFLESGNRFDDQSSEL